MINKDIKNYLNDISRYLVCTKKQKKIILEDIEISVRDYIENANVKNMSEVYNHFGSPEDIAKTYLANFVKPSDIRKAISKKKVLIIVALIAFIILLVALTIALIDGHFTNSGYIIEGTPQEMLIYSIYLLDKGVLL